MRNTTGAVELKKAQRGNPGQKNRAKSKKALDPSAGKIWQIRSGISPVGIKF
jgi:hypothetical protein